MLQTAFWSTEMAPNGVLGEFRSLPRALDARIGIHAKNAVDSTAQDSDSWRWRPFPGGHSIPHLFSVTDLCLQCVFSMSCLCLVCLACVFSVSYLCLTCVGEWSADVSVSSLRMKHFLLQHVLRDEVVAHALRARFGELLKHF